MVAKGPGPDSSLSRKRVFVGTLASGEAELQDCIKAISAQEGVQVTHSIIEGLPELEAHNELWRRWDAAKDEHDVMVKIDADTILLRPTALEEVTALFASPKAHAVQIPLHDHLTGRLINGLNAYSPACLIRPSADRLYTDRIIVNRDNLVSGDAVRHLTPIGIHSPSPHPRQAFHYGLHRAMKQQWDVIGDVATLWKEKRDDARGWALLGARAAIRGFGGSFDYGARSFELAFEQLSANAHREQLIDAFVRKFLWFSKGRIRLLALRIALSRSLRRAGLRLR